MRTREDITRAWGWGSTKRVTIPAGTPCVPATNLPGGREFWICPRSEWSDDLTSWAENYGFSIGAELVEG